MNTRYFPLIGAVLGALALVCLVVLFMQCSAPVPAPVTPVPLTPTHTPTQMPTITQAPSITPTETLSPTPTELPPTETPIPTDIPTPTNTPEPTATPTLTISPSVTPIHTVTPGRPTELPKTGGTGPSNAGVFISIVVAFVLFFWAFDAAQLADEKNNYPPA